jgi:uncharacterized tellurite resistance protein B-like protein
MLADGNMCKSEQDVLTKLDACGQLGLGPQELHQVVHALCEDLLATSNRNWGAACRVDETTISALLAEIDAPALRLRVLNLCAAVSGADRQWSEGELRLLQTALVDWRMPPSIARPLAQQAGWHHG